MSAIKDQLKQIRDTLHEFAQGENGGAFICGDMAHLYNLLWTSSQGLRILVLYHGESIREVFPGAAVLGRVDRDFIVVVSRGRSISAVERGKPLVDNNVNARPLFDVVSEVRDICRAFVFAPEDERPVDYKGITPFPTGDTGMAIDAYTIEFSVGTQLPLILSQPDSQLVAG